MGSVETCVGYQGPRRTITYRILEQHLRDMRKFEWDHELVDLEHGYNLVRLLCKQDYERALIDGLWLIMAHYLTVSKWRRFSG